MNLYRCLFTAVILLYPLIGQSQDISFDMAIEHAQVVDGSGNKSYYAHIGIMDGVIEQIERDTSKTLQAKRKINAGGKIVTPGFIDTHAHGNPLKTPDFKNFLAMGVTSIFLGQDGNSPRQEDLAKWMKEVEAKEPGVNIGLFAGHNTLRMLSGIEYDSLPGKEGLDRMSALLEQALDDGCFGMSTGLEYNPGYHAKAKELQRLAWVVGKYGGLIMSHLRSEDDAEVESAIDELLAQGKYCPVHISHLKVVYGKGEERALEILGQIDSARERGIRVTADIYPYNASYTGIGLLFPAWAKEPNDYYEVLRNRRTELREHLREIVAKRNGPEATLIGSGRFSGKTLAEIAAETGKPFDVVLTDDIGPRGAGAAYFVMNDSLQKTLLTHPLVNICTDGSPSMRHPRGYGSFAKVIENFVLEDQLLTLEEAVYKMTGLPAETLGLWGRGIIECGAEADLLVFDPAEIKATATYEEPHQLATGMSYVIVNGKIAKEGQKFAPKGNGKVLKRVLPLEN